MDAHDTKDVWWFWTQLWPSLVVALGIYAGGVTAGSVSKVLVPASKDLVDGKTTDVPVNLPMLFRLWWATHSVHPLIVGGAIAFIPQLPRPEWVSSTASAVAWFAFVGLGNGQVHAMSAAFNRQLTKAIDLFVPWVRQKLGLPARPSSSPPPPAGGASDGG